MNIEGPTLGIERWRDRLGRSAVPIWIALVAFLLALPSLLTGFGADDHYFRMVLQGSPGLPELTQHPLDLFTFAHGEAEANAAAIERGLLPWWSSPTVRLAFWRPLAAVTHAFDHRMWPDNTVVAHLHSVIWFALLGLTVGFMYRRYFDPRWIAGLAALLYVIDDARVVAVAWAATRNTTMSAIAAALVLIAHDRWRRGGWRPGAWLAPLALGVGLLCGEAAIGVVGYLLAHALFLDRGSPARRIAGLAPCAGVTLVWSIAYRQMGYGASGSGLYIDPAGSPLRFAVSTLEHLPVLMLDQFAGLNPALWVVLPEVWGWAYASVGVVLLLLVGAALLPLLAREPVLRFWSVGMLLAAIPACAVFPQNRVLFVVGFGGMGLIARGIAAWLERPATLFDGARWKTAIGTLAPLAVVTHLLLAPVVGMLTTGWMALLDHQVARAERSIPRDASIAGQDVTVVALPSDILQHEIPYVRSSLRWPAPRRLLALYAGLGALEIHRPDERTLEVAAERTFVSRPWAQMFRGPAAEPFSAGDRIRLSGVSIEVLEADARGRPTRVAFRFDRALEAATDHWLTWSDGVLVEFEPPAVGGSVRTDPIELRQVIWHNIADFIGSGAWARTSALDTGPLVPRR